MRALLFQHTPEESPGTLTDWLESRGIAHDVHPWYSVRTAPPQASFDWLVILGGPMNLDQEDEYPWLREEKKFLRRWLATGKPVLGICLGGQLLAQALGGNVTKNPEREIGFQEIRLTGEKHPALRRWPEALKVYQYHEDTFSLPHGTRPLLASPACANQAYAVGTKLLGLQFHPESTRAWIEGNAASVSKGAHEKWVQTPAETAAVTAELLPPMTKAFHALLEDFVAGWRG